MGRNLGYETFNKTSFQHLKSPEKTFQKNIHKPLLINYKTENEL